MTPDEVGGAPALRRHVEMLAGTIGERNIWTYRSLNQAAGYVADALAATGAAVQRQTYEVSRLPVQNIEATCPGTSRASEIVVVGAHYDTVSGCPGANDNGTGVASVLELARRLAKDPHPRTLRFVAFVNEEPPFFHSEQMGSRVYAEACRAAGDRITAMLSLETMGYYSDAPGSQQYPEPLAKLYPNVGNFIGMVSNVASGRLLLKVRRAFRTRTPFPIQIAAAPASLPGVAWSDQWAFWEAGYPAIMVTDTAPFRYPWYHSAQDTPDKIAFDKLSVVVDGLEAAIRRLAGS